MKNPSEGSGHDECIICNRMVANTITSTDGSNQFEIHKYDGCITKMWIYAISCSKCSKPVYVGETEGRFEREWQNIWRTSGWWREKPVAKHFTERDHRGVNDVEICILERIHDKSRIFRLIKEKSWISKMKTEVPVGINTKVGLSVLWREYN